MPCFNPLPCFVIWAKFLDLSEFLGASIASSLEKGIMMSTSQTWRLAQLMYLKVLAKSVTHDEDSIK